MLYLSECYSVLICLSGRELLVGVLLSLYTRPYAQTKFTGLYLISRYSNGKCSDAICSFVPLNFSFHTWTHYPDSFPITLIIEFHSDVIFQRIHALCTRHPAGYNDLFKSRVNCYLSHITSWTTLAFSYVHKTSQSNPLTWVALVICNGWVSV